MTTKFIQIAAAYNEAQRSKRDEESQQQIGKRMERLLAHRKKLNRIYRQAVEEISAQLVNRQYKVSSTKCPQCHRYFLSIIFDGQELHFCEHCNGYWFDTGQLKHFTNLFEDVPGGHLKSRESRYSCPTCGARMKECAFLNRGNLLVDKCPDGHGVYLESGEFNRALNLSADHPVSNKTSR